MINSALTSAPNATNIILHPGEQYATLSWRYIHPVPAASWVSTMVGTSLINLVPLKSLYWHEDGLCQPWTHLIINPNRLHSARGCDSIQAWFAAGSAALLYNLCKGKRPKLQQSSAAFKWSSFTPKKDKEFFENSNNRLLQHYVVMTVFRHWTVQIRDWCCEEIKKQYRFGPGATVKPSS
jgi:hypothetical protein